MTARQSQNHSLNHESATVGLAANGCAGSWTIDLDESTSGAEKWFLQIEGPALYLYFQVSGATAIHNILAFFEVASSQNSDELAISGRCSELEIGRFGASPVLLISDFTSSPSITVCIAGGEGSTARLSIPKSEWSDVVDALRQIRDSLSEDAQ